MPDRENPAADEPAEDTEQRTPAEEEALAEEEAMAEFDVWRWHTEGRFPKDQPPEQGYVHIGMYVAWLAANAMLDAEWAAQTGAGQAIEAMTQRREPPTALRDLTDGRLAAEMLTPEGRAFTGAYYAPEYGYARDWRKIFGRRADRYDVPDGWETYDEIAPLLDWQYQGWVASGKPEMMPLPGLLGGLVRIFRPKSR